MAGRAATARRISRWPTVTNYGDLSRMYFVTNSTIDRVDDGFT